MRRLVFGVLAAAGLSVVLLGVGGVIGRSASSPAPVAAAAPPPVPALEAAITRDQQRLKNVPGDYTTWAALGTAYLEQARVSADPSFYPKSEGALKRSLSLRPADNAPALIGLGALANARHDFATALTYATRALAIDSYSADAYAVLTDAHTQLGHAAEATDAVQHLLDLRPGLSALTRASYELELHGQDDHAASLMQQALTDATDPADVAFCRYQLGELAFAHGDLDGALASFTAGLAADASYLPLVQGRAKVYAAQGRYDRALADYSTVTSRMPTPAYLMEYATVLRAAGRPLDADGQLELAAAAQHLFAANGGVDDLGGAQLAIAQHRPADAVALATKEWQRRPFADVADTLAWSLHLAGRDKEALVYAGQAQALGARPAQYLFHQGAIESSLGQRSFAVRDVRAALATNPHFSPVDAPEAARLLMILGS
jgi:tetratricopeptide (TPR) repeat protein